MRFVVAFVVGVLAFTLFAAVLDLHGWQLAGFGAALGLWRLSHELMHDVIEDAD